MATAGRRLRVLWELYDPHMTDDEAARVLASIAEALAAHPGAVVASYVEANPPADELP